MTADSDELRAGHRRHAHSVALLRDVMTAILVRFEWHGELSAVRDGPALLQRPPPRRQTTDPCNKATVVPSMIIVWIHSRLPLADPTSIATSDEEAIAQMVMALRLITLAFGTVVGTTRH
jgi:hypothetical protein